MKILSKGLVLGLFISLFVGFAAPALAYNPILNVYSSGGTDVTVSITGGQPNAAVVISYTPSGTNLPTNISGMTDYGGNFTTMVSSVSYGINGGAQIYATVGGQQVYANYNNGYNGGCTYNCGSPYGLSLSQTSLSLSVGQSSTVTIYNNNNNYNYNNYYIAGNSNSGVASASISGNSLYIYALVSGSTTVQVCQNGYSGNCASVYVTVSGSVLGASNYSVSARDNYFSPQTITVPAGSSVSFRNDGIMSHTVTFDSPYTDSGTLYPGNTYTQTFNTAGTYYYHCRFHSGMTGIVIVTGTAGGSGNLSLSQTSLNLTAGQSASVSAYNSGFGIYVSSNSNSGVASYTVSGNTINITALNSGSTTLTVCASSGNACASLYVNVSGNNYGGCGSYGCTSNLSLSQTSLNLNIGQSQAVNIFGSGSYYVSSNSNAVVASANISGNTLNVYASQNGSTTISVCQNSNSPCASLYVTVGGYSYNYGGGLQYPGGSSVLGASAYGNGQLISENGTVYIVYKNTKTGFVSASVFRALGFSFSNVVSVGNSGLVDSGYIVRSSQASHPWGAWIKSGQTVYFVHETGLIPVSNWSTFLNNGGQASLIVPANSYDFALPMLAPMANNDSRLR